MNVGVHETHCCFKHGCKYGYPLINKKCPVYCGKIKQEYPCEECDDSNDIKLFFGCWIEVFDPIIKDIKTEKSQKKWCLNEDCPVDKKYGLDKKFTSCPYCKSDLDYKDIVKSQKYPTETNLGLKDVWEVIEVREFPNIKKLFFLKSDLKKSTGINVQKILSIKYLEDIKEFIKSSENSVRELEEFVYFQHDTINLLEENFKTVLPKFGLISVPNNYFNKDYYDM